MRRLPPDAFAYYLGLGVGRSYQAVADRFGVTKTAVVNLATRDHWAEKLVQAERRVGEAAARKAEETIEQMNDRHIRSLKAIQGKAIEALKRLDLDSAYEAVRTLELAIRQERVIRGEPTERAAVEVEDIIKREYDHWLAPPDAGEEVAAASGGEPVGETSADTPQVDDA